MKCGVNRFWSWRAVTRRAMWPYMFVVPPPPLGQNLHLNNSIKDFPVEQLIPEFSVKRFDIAVFPWAARLYEQGLGTHSLQPFCDGF